jgi:hypothetical protein
MPRQLKPCGTPAAYRRHLRHGQEPCDDCREAEYARNRVGPRPLQPCGTAAGAYRHRRAGEPVCEPCHTAERTYQNTWRANRHAKTTGP